MGWLYYYRERGQSDVDHFAEKFADDSPYRLVDGATKRNVFYGAVEEKSTGDVSAMVCLIDRFGDGTFNFGYKDMDEFMGPCETECPARILNMLSPLPECSHDEDYCRFCDAEITLVDGEWLREAKPGQADGVAGPRCYTGIPVSALGPNGEKPLHEPGGTASCGTCWARKWREACAATIERAAARPKVRKGDTIKFETAYEFVDGSKQDTFTVVDGRRNRYRGANGMLYRLPTKSRWPSYEKVA